MLLLKIPLTGKRNHQIEGEVVGKTSSMGLEMRNSFGVKDRIIFCMTKSDLKNHDFLTA